MRRSPEALLAAYLDGVGELSPDERREVEAWLRDEPAAAGEADATRALLGQLRDMPTRGDEPRWSELEHAIGKAVGELPMPGARRVRWSRWLMPAVGFVMATAALLLWFHQPGNPTTPEAPKSVAHAPTLPTAAMHVATPAAPAAPTTTVWLDGQAVDLDDIDDPAGVLEDFVSDEMATAGVEENADPSDGLLPSGDLGWMDDLDSGSLDRIDGWLRRAKG